MLSPTPNGGTPYGIQGPLSKAKFVRRTSREPEWRAIHRIADAVYPSVRARISRALRVSVAPGLTVRLREADTNGALALVDFDSMAERLAGAVPALTRAYAQAGRTTVRRIKRNALRKALSEDAFKTTNPLAVEWAKTKSSELVTGVVEESRKAIRELVTRGFVEGIPPLQLAKLIQGAAGVSSVQAHAIVNQWNQWKAQGLPDAVVKSNISKLQDRMLRTRAETIARTEVMTASNAGQHAAWMQGKTAGLVDTHLVKELIVTPDDLLCPICAEFAGQQRQTHEEFGFGRQAPPVHPRCRCTVGLAEPKDDFVVDKPAVAKPPKAEPVKPHALPKPASPVLLSQRSTAWVDELLSQQIAPAKGSNQGGLFRAADGTKYYVKTYGNPDQGWSEVAANNLYRSLGLNAPDSYVLRDGAGRSHFVSRWLDDVDGTLGNVGITSDTANKVLDGFVADVLTVNWDAVGTGHDNIIRLKNGTLVRIDQGGTFLFRAQGALKPQGVLHTLNEWESLVDDNHYYRQVFDIADVANANALGQRAVDQIDDVIALRGRYSSWDEFVFASAPQMPDHLRSEIASALDARYARLLTKREELLQALTRREMVPATPGAWPISDSVIRRQGRVTHERMRTHYSDWIDGLSPSENLSIQDYTGSSYRQMNESLRENGVFTAQAKTLQSALLKTPRPMEEMLVWRTQRGWPKEFKTGDVIRTEGFWSTSIRPDLDFESGVFLEILPSCGAYVYDQSSNKSEREFLIPHGQGMEIIGTRTVNVDVRGVVRERTIIQLRGIGSCD